MTTLPLGKAARATRAVSEGISPIGFGWRHMGQSFLLEHNSGIRRQYLTYIPMPKGFFYLVAIMDWHSRKVLTWRLSNTMDATFCVEALEEALDSYGRPEIFNSDQGAQFTIHRRAGGRRRPDQHGRQRPLHG